VPGTGPAGRITHDDLDTFARRSTGAPAPAANGAPAAAAPAPGQRAAPDTSVVERPIIGVRRVIAERMVASTRSIPHITYVEEVDVTALEELRSTLNESRGQDQPRLTLLPFLIRALVNHLPEHPELNAHVDDERGMLRLFGAVHVGIATQTSNGLVVPVVRHAETGTIWSLAARVAAAAEAAREGTAAPSDLSGSTITITSLGPMGGLVTTPVINKPEVAIVGVNKIAIRPVWADGMFVPRKVMNLSSSFDHRIVDGWEAASFVQRLRASLEQPALLFVDRS
jgi:2-oxoisovalerate dehydrogenase E2 component (dihydrolipoyl transacylase)